MAWENANRLVTFSRKPCSNGAASRGTIIPAPWPLHPGSPKSYGNWEMPQLRRRLRTRFNGLSIHRQSRPVRRVCARTGPPAAQIPFLTQRRGTGGWPCACGSAGQVQDGVGVLDGLAQHADRLWRGQDDRIALAAAGIVPDLL